MKNLLIVLTLLILSGCNDPANVVVPEPMYSAHVSHVGGWEFNAPENKIVLLGLYSDVQGLPSGRSYEFEPSHELQSGAIFLSMTARAMSKFDLAIDGPIQRYEVPAPAGVYSVVDKASNRVLGRIDTQVVEGRFRD